MNWKYKSLTGSAFAVVMLLEPAWANDPPTRTIPIAVAGFDYIDTSGEARNQEAEHQARLQTFMRTIRADLADSGKFRIVEFACPKESCSAAQANAEQLIEDARRAGARLLLYGGIRKMSTLIQNAKAQVIDVEANQLVFDRLLSFRGDSDEAWQHAEQFLVRDLVSKDFSH